MDKNKNFSSWLSLRITPARASFLGLANAHLHVIAFCCHLVAVSEICGILQTVGCSWLRLCCWCFTFTVVKNTEVDKDLLCDGGKLMLNNKDCTVEQLSELVPCVYLPFLIFGSLFSL